MDLLFLGVTVLLITTAGSLSFYYRRLRKLVKQYDEARTLVSDIVISFNKQVQRQEEKLGIVAKENMLLTSKNGKTESKLEAQESQIEQLSVKLSELLRTKSETPDRFISLEQRLNEAREAQEKLSQKITILEERAKRPPTADVNIEAVIPIKQERALAPLTPTELLVLETLANEGEKTAPEIRTRTGLTREHTARLMKKLYEAGYLERTTGKIPFAYRIKEEMRKILKKPEAKA
jgi:predicted transcriptional regulator